FSTQNGVAYVIQREPEATQALAAFRDGTPFEETVLGSAVVEVQNGNGIPGSASAVSAVIEAGGYEVKGTSDSDRADYQITLVVARPRALPQADAIVALLGYGEATTGATPNGVDVVVIVGADASS
ncbi:MAG: LytR C-terminal domain-containing protein, partial [Actinomycetota bacterium]